MAGVNEVIVRAKARDGVGWDDKGSAGDVEDATDLEAAGKAAGGGWRRRGDARNGKSIRRYR